MNLPAPPNGARRSPEWGALRDLAPHLWPAGNLAVRGRVLLAMTLLAGAKFATVYVPLLFKRLVDLFATPHNAPIVLPIGLVVGYGVLRVAAIAFAELRDAVFAKVAQRAIRTVALKTFRHLHSLSLRFHLERQTGGMTRDIERGTRGICVFDDGDGRRPTPFAARSTPQFNTYFKMLWEELEVHVEG